MPRKNLIFAAPVVLLPVLWLFSEIQQVRRVYPPDDARTLSLFLNMNRSVELRRFEYAGKTYVSATDLRPSYFISLPSGPPVYVFDDSGKLVDWCKDTGDGAVLLGGWNDWSADKKITAEEAVIP